MKTATLEESTFNGLCNMEQAIKRHIAIHQNAGNAALVAHLEALLTLVNTTKAAALDAAKGGGS